MEGCDLFTNALCTLSDLCYELDFDQEESRMLFGKILNTGDFTVGDYRFIDCVVVDEVMKDEFRNEPYMIGSCNSWVTADLLGVSTDVIDLLQKNEQYEAIGMLVLETNKLDKFIDTLISNDGYGHHFGIYDGEEHYVDISLAKDKPNAFYWFKIN